MKTYLIGIACFLGAISICNAQEKLNLNLSESSIKWSCDYVFYFNGHHGTIDFQDGYFELSEGKITGGEFIIDMNSIVCLDIEDQESNESLVNHIKDPDFFDVPNYPKSKLVITNVIYHDEDRMEVSANLKIKDSNLPIQFQAKIDNNARLFTTKFKIDRTRWGVTYNSDIKDGAISDAIGFEVNLNWK